MSDEIKTFLSKEPLKQAASTLFAIQRIGRSKEGMNIVSMFPHLESKVERDWSFLHRYHEDALSMIPKKYRTFTKERLLRFGSPMTEDDVQLSRLSISMKRFRFEELTNDTFTLIPIGFRTHFLICI